MNDIDILFVDRSVVGARLEKLLAEREYTKAGFCKECGISRPTLDKILSGTIGSMTNYEKHMRKILNCLSITPEVLIGDSLQVHSRARQLRTLLRIKKEDIAAAIEISVDRLEEIEAGAPMTNAELRDLAVYLGTSTSCIMSNNVFYPQTTTLSDFISEIDDDGAALSGYWGHLGVMPSGSTEYSWYPITRYEADKLGHSLKGKKAVVPCMNNKLLYLNLEKIKSIVLLDEACDPPEYYNWDYSVGEGEIPLVVYEVLEDYDPDNLESDEKSATEYSPKLQKSLNQLIEEKKCTEDQIFKMTSGIKIRYADGSAFENLIELDYESDLIDAVSDLYMMPDVANVDKYVSFTDWNGAETFINTDEVAVIEMPLVGVERKIMESFEEWVEETE